MQAHSRILGGVVSGTQETVQRGACKICPHFWDARVAPTNMHGI